MSKRGGETAFSGGDPISRYLIDVSADRAAPYGGPIPAGMVELAQRHGLIPLLARLNSDRLVRAIHAREASRSGVLERHLGTILEMLHSRGVRAAVVKGPSVALRYVDPSLRLFSDLDLLVPESDVGRALDVLGDYPATVSVPDKRPKADKRDVLMRDESGIVFNLDLHWDLFSYSQLRGGADGATEWAWEEARLAEDSPLGPLWDLPDATRIAFLSAHAVLDHRFRMILFRDFLEIARESVAWDSVTGLAGRWGLRSTTYLALWIARSALAASVPAAALDELRPGSAPIGILEWMLPRVDLIRFDGHRPHPVNLAAVLLNDSRTRRLGLLLRAPGAFPRWRQRVAGEEKLLGPPRTLILASTDRRRGAEVFTERLRAGLTLRGWVVEALALRGQGEEPRADLEALTEWEGGRHRRFEIAIVAALRRKLKAFRPAVVLANGGATLRYASVARFGRAYRLVYVAIGEPGYWLRSGFSRRLNRFMLRRVDHVIAVSETTRAQLIALEPGLAGRVSVGYTGVPRDLFGITRTNPAGPLHVLMIGSLTAEKAPERALGAVASLPDARLRYVGSGPLRPELERRAVEMGLANRVEFRGSVIDITTELEWAHLLVLTSRSEGLPGAILEASASGIPTVSFDVGGVREAVIDGETGFVARDDEELSNALKSLDADRVLLRAMGDSAREHASTRFALEPVLDRYAEILTEAAR